MVTTMKLCEARITRGPAELRAVQDRLWEDLTGKLGSKD